VKNIAFTGFMLFSVLFYAQNNKSDTIVIKNLISSQLKYSCKDSLVYNFSKKQVCLYGQAKVQYEQTTLTAGIICINFEKELMFARGIKDSLGHYVQKPTLKEKESEIKSDSLLFQFKTKKGIVYNIFTEENGGYVHGQIVKQMNDSIYLIKNGSFTTCDLEHPHYSIRFDKAEVVKNHKILTGTVWLEVEDIPTPIALPFGYFPNQKKRTSGILIPSYGESANRGFFLENGGYYFGISDYIDLALRGDIYSRGSWALKVTSNYKKRYKYQGTLNFNYAYNVFGEKFTPQYEKHKDLFIRWQHQQDPKARPKSRFSAYVQIGTSNYTTYNPANANDYLSSTYSSSIAYVTQLSPSFNLSINANHSQNKQTHQFSMSLPDIVLASNRWYPFRSPRKPNRKFKILDNINFSYTSQLKNNYVTFDSLFVQHFKYPYFNYGIRHSVPIFIPMQLFKVVTWNTSINLNEKWYFQTIRKRYDNITNQVYIDTSYNFKPVHEISLNSNFSTQLFTFFTYKKGPIRAIRHVLTPTMGFSWNPDYGKAFWGYYRYFVPPGNTKPVPYSIFNNPIFGAPSLGKNSLIIFNLNNNLEMKVRSKKDTISGFKKIVLIDNFNLGCSYNLAADSLNWSKINMSGRTALFKGLDLRYSAVFDPYIIDSTGKNVNTLEWNAHGRLFRKNSSLTQLSLNYTLSSAQLSKHKNGDSTLFLPTWSLQIAYSFQYNENLLPGVLHPFQRIQTLSLLGEFKPTKNWRVSFMTGYDFTHKGLSYTSINIYRDLHCWEIIFNWIPTGFRKSYNFTLRIKSPMLQDLKLTKKTDFRDYY